MNRAEILLRNLAKIEPIKSDINSYTITCLVCYAYGVDLPIKHKKTCFWKRAVEYFRRS